MFIYVPYRMFNNYVQLLLIFHDIILHIHNAIATYAAETWGKVLLIVHITQI